MNNCIFCKIVSGEMPCHKVWEDKKHLAFLDIFPTTKGASLVITKKHHTSNYLNVDDVVLKDLLIASKKVSLLLEKALSSVLRVVLIVEGIEVDHLHYKLFPIHDSLRQAQGPAQTPKRADDKELAKLTRKIQNANISSNPNL